MDYYNLAIKRESTRSFKKRPISNRQLTELQNYLPSCRKLFPEIHTDITILGADAAALLNGVVGYFGLMIEAPHYLLVSSAPHDYVMENAGFMGEDLVLKLTELEVESCWITIQNPLEVKNRLNLAEDLVPMALVAFGNATVMLPSSRLDIKSVSDVSIKERTGFIAPKLAVSYAVRSGDWTDSEELEALPLRSGLYSALIAACCAPSYLNLQPYRFILDSETLSLVCLPDDQTAPDDARLNAGIVMLHYAGVMEKYYASPNGWVMGAPAGKDYKLPDGAWIAGHYQIKMH